MGIRRQFVLDKKTDRAIGELALDGYGSRSRVVRAAVDALTEREAMFERIESDPGFIRMMEESEKAFQEGRFITHEEMKRRVRAQRKGNKRKKK